MTIIYAAVRPGFVVLAADQRAPARDGAGERLPDLFFPKIHVHPRLPVAVATSGMGVLRERTTDERVALALSGVTMPDLNLDRIGRLLYDRLWPLVQEARTEGRYATEFGIRGTSLVVGFCRRGEAELGLVLLADECSTARPDSNTEILRPEHLATFYTTGQFAAGGAGHGRDLTSPEHVVARARECVRAGIVEEVRVAKAQTAGPVDVVLIDRQGARLIGDAGS